MGGRVSSPPCPCPPQVLLLRFENALDWEALCSEADTLLVRASLVTKGTPPSASSPFLGFSVRTVARHHRTNLNNPKKKDPTTGKLSQGKYSPQSFQTPLSLDRLRLGHAGQSDLRVNPRMNGQSLYKGQIPNTKATPTHRTTGQRDGLPLLVILRVSV